MKPEQKNGRIHPTVRLMEKLNKYSYSTLFTIWASMAILFGFAYFGLTYLGDGIHAPQQLLEIDSAFIRFMDAIYYSVITATSTGYGDITPHGFSRILASMQSISALFVFAVFVTKLVSHQQEMTLTEVHRLTFEDVFHNTREGMYICRKDFDHIMRYAEQHNALDQEHLDNMTSAYKQIQTYLEEIPDFYQNEIHKYTIDSKREELLLESVHRTLHRINQMLDLLSSRDIDWVAHEPSMKELQEIVAIISDITPLWKERSPYEAFEAFEDIIQTKERVHARLHQSML